MRALLLFVASALGAQQTEPWRDASLPIPQRVAALLSVLTPAEKLWQLQRAAAGYNVSALSETGVGMLECPELSRNAASPSEFAANRNAVVSAFLASETGPGRLGLTPSFRTLATHGIRSQAC